VRWAVLKYFIGLKDIATLKRDKCRLQVDLSPVEFCQELHRIESFEILRPWSSFLRPTREKKQRCLLNFSNIEFNEVH